jgi:hypothetical protein
MSQATDNLVSALAKLATEGQTKRNAHAAHDSAASNFSASQLAYAEALKAVVVEADQIAADSDKPADAMAPEAANA